MIVLSFLSSYHYSFHSLCFHWHIAIFTEKDSRNAIQFPKSFLLIFCQCLWLWSSSQGVELLFGPVPASVVQKSLLSSACLLNCVSCMLVLEVYPLILSRCWSHQVLHFNILSDTSSVLEVYVSFLMNFISVGIILVLSLIFHYAVFPPISV